VDGKTCVMNLVTCTVKGNIIRLMKSGNMKWPGHVECTGEMRRAHEVSAGKQEG